MILLCLASLVLSMLLGLLTFTAQKMMVTDVALAGISVTTALMMVFLSGEALVGEIEKRTIDFMLSKPVTRFHFLLSTFLGLMLVGAFSIGIGGVTLVALLYFFHGTIALGLTVALVYMILEIAIIASMGIMFSSFSSSSLTAILLCALVYILGHVNPQLAVFARLLRNELAGYLINAIRFLLPNLEYFNIRHEVSRGGMPGVFSLILTLGYTLLYVGSGITVAFVAFRRREL